MEGGNGLERVGVAQQGCGVGVALGGEDRAPRVAGDPGVVGGCEGLVGAGGECGVGEEAGGPADDGLIRTVLSR